MATDETGSAGSTESDAPNVVLILADNLGWGDIGYHDDRIQTPRIDRFVEESVELDRFYAAPICTPKRCGVMTGRSPIRYGRMRSVLPPWRVWGSRPTNEPSQTNLGPPVTSAEPVSGSGISAIRRPSKPSQPGIHPVPRAVQRRFDYHSHTREGELEWHENDAPSYEDGYAADLLTNHVVEFI